MSHFHLPRINFVGKCTHDPATANNGFYVPLVIYDPLKVKVVLPPRIYFTQEAIASGESVESAEALRPEGVEVRTEHQGRFSGIPFIEIEPIDTVEKFREWAVKPLGDYPDDKAYIPLYKVMVGENTNKPIYGSCPGYWNYYGSMKFDFGWSDESGSEEVMVSSVAIPCKQGESKSCPNNEDLLTPDSADVPEDVSAVLGATVSLDNIFGNPGTFTSVMTDLDPTFALYTQIFNDAFGIYKDGNTLLKGNPCKFSLRFVNVFRIVNETMPNSGSGDFCATIAISDIEGGMDSPVMKLMQTYADTRRKLEGIFIRFNLLEVQENRPPDYQKWGSAQNPAKMTVAGSIGPWYRGEMRSLVMGRQLLPSLPFIQQGQVSLPPSVLIYDPIAKELVFDALNWLPLINKSYDNVQPSPPTGTNPVYQTYDLGELTLLYDKDNAPAGTPSIHLATFSVGQTAMPRETFLASGGILRFPVDMDEKELLEGTLSLEGPNDKGTVVSLMREGAYMLGSDQAGLYANQGDDPALGYVSYGYPKEPCILRVFSKGKPIKDGLKISVQENKVTAGGGYQKTNVLRNTVYRDGDPISFPTDQACNAMYLLMPYENFTGKALGSGALQGQIIATGAFISLRVLPRHNYGKYLDPNHPRYPTPVTWEVVQKEIFDTIVTIYPFMNITKEAWNNATMAAQVMNHIDEHNWASSSYMPTTRDLSDDQRHLLEKWATGLGVAVPLDFGDSTETTVVRDWTHLAKKHIR